MATGSSGGGVEPDLALLLKKGRLIEQPIQLLNMPLQRCHENAAVVWSKDVAETKIVVGYGLYMDGPWRQHTWAAKDSQSVGNKRRDGEVFRR